MTYENKLKTAYEHGISCFNKFLPNNSLTKLMSVYKSKCINPNLLNLLERYPKNKITFH